MVRLLRSQHRTGNVICDKVEAVGSNARRCCGWAGRRSAAAHVQVTMHTKLGPRELDVNGPAAWQGVTEELELLQGLVCVAGIARTHVERRLVSQILVGVLPRLRVEADCCRGSVASVMHSQRPARKRGPAD